MDFESGDPTIVRSIKQRDLLNTWLRLYAPSERLPDVTRFVPERLADEQPDLVYYTVDGSVQPPRLTIQSSGTRMSRAYGDTGKGRLLDEYVGPRMAPIVMPVYYACISRALPAYSISLVNDVEGRPVAYERLLLPFSNGHGVTDVVASLKTISEDGRFEIKNLLRGHDSLPEPKLRAVIDRSLAIRPATRPPIDDVIELD